MTTTPKILNDAEQLVRQLANELTLPEPGECLCCYVDRQLAEFRCNGTHRLAEHYRDVMAPRATALLRRLRAVGACCCDCELFLNGYVPRVAVLPDGRLTEAETVQLPPCAGVRRGSITPCRNWVRMRRRW